MLRCTQAPHTTAQTARISSCLSSNKEPVDGKAHNQGTQGAACFQVRRPGSFVSCARQVTCRKRKGASESAIQQGQPVQVCDEEHRREGEQSTWEEEVMARMK